MSAQSTWDGLPPLAKTVIAITATVTVIGVGVLIYFKITNAMKNAGNLKEKKDVSNALSELKAKGIKPSYSPATYSQAANMVFTALDGYGTDKAVVKRVFENLKNDADFLSLMDAYGIREVNSGRGNVIVANYKGTMAGAIADEYGQDLLGRDEVKELNEILKKKNITYFV